MNLVHRHLLGLYVESRKEGRTWHGVSKCPNCTLDLEGLTYRERKLLMRFPSTPVIKEGPIGKGKDVAAGKCGSAFDDEATGVSKEIFVIAS